MRMMTNKGFSMAEVMVVMLVVGITLAASIPSYTRYRESTSMNSAAEQIAGHFRLLRQTAVSEGTPYIFAWTAVNIYYTIEDSDGDGWYTSGEDFEGPYYLPGTARLWRFTNFTSSWISLLPNGTSAQGGSIDFVNDRDQMFRLTLLPSTGQVHILKEVPGV